jgi:protein-S-isoprenylcysteine O-methyltransferase Ste14
VPKRSDRGRLVMLPLATALATGNALSALSGARSVELTRPATLVHLVGAVLVAGFYGLVVVVYVRRGDAVASAASRAVKTAALVGGWLPLAFPYVAGRAGGSWVTLGSNLLLVLGMAVSLVALRTLGGCFSVVPEARGLVCSGPYAVVRHPLYLGELVAAAGVVLRGPSVAGALLWCLLLSLQAYRVSHEERVLTTSFPDYRRYRTVTRWRIVPGVI